MQARTNTTQKVSSKDEKRSSLIGTILAISLVNLGSQQFHCVFLYGLWSFGILISLISLLSTPSCFKLSGKFLTIPSLEIEIYVDKSLIWTVVLAGSQGLVWIACWIFENYKILFPLCQHHVWLQLRDGCSFVFTQLSRSPNKGFWSFSLSLGFLLNLNG